jgi:hypothetical protein
LVEGQSISPHKNALSLVTSMSDSELLQCNLLASPCPDPRCRHEVTLVKNCASAAAGLDIAIKRAEHEYVVCVHQDVYLPDGWDRCVMQQFQEAEGRFGPVGVAGVYGVGEVIEADDSTQPLGAARIGWVVDRGRLLRDGPELPARVATLDELLLVVRCDSGLRFDPDLGFHLYGADICLHARERGLAVVALGALCYHNSRGAGLPEAFYRSAGVFARKWSHRLPVDTPCVIIDVGGEVYLLGNAMERPGRLRSRSNAFVGSYRQPRAFWDKPAAKSG